MSESKSGGTKNYYELNKSKIKAYQVVNSSKIKTRKRLKYIENRESRWAENIFKKYGITSQQYYELASKQNNKCKICDKTEQERSPSGRTQKLAVDHCHSTGVVRGLLCTKCNSAIGLFLESSTTLKTALNYLQSSDISIMSNYLLKQLKGA